MNVKVRLACLIALFVSGAVQAQQKLDSLLVYGDNFIFSFKEPDGWVTDTEHATEYQANALLYPKSQSWQNADGMIRIRVNGKTDENVEKDVAADMSDYRQHFATIQFRDIAVSHPTCHVFPKVFFVKNTFYEYVTYVNPGPQSALMFSVSMNKQKTEATQSELTAFQKVISSLNMLKAPRPNVRADEAAAQPQH